MISRLSRVPIEPVSFNCAGVSEHVEPIPKTAETANPPAEPAPPPAEDAERDAVASPDAPEALLEFRLQEAAKSKTPADDGTPMGGGPDAADALLQSPLVGNVEPEKSLEVLLRLAAGARFFRSAEGRLFARVPVDSRHEIHGLKSTPFRDWLIKGYFADRGEIPAQRSLAAF